MDYLTFKFHSNNKLINTDETRRDHTPNCAAALEIRFSQAQMSIDFCLLSKDLDITYAIWMFFIVHSTLLKYS